MISNWRWDDGSPDYMPAINQWTNPRRPAWRCQYHTLRDHEEIMLWLRENWPNDSEFIYRFNSGAPYLEIALFSDEAATDFRLRYP